MERGDVIRNKGTGYSYVVVGIVDGHVIAARTVEVSNPMEWETISREYKGWQVPPKLIDRADGNKGRYTIGRSKEGVTYEFWNAETKTWGAFGTVFDYESGNDLLIKWNSPNARL